MWWIVLLVIVGLLLVVAIHDLVQRKRAILRNFPVIGHLRYLIEKIGPELRQYVVADNNEELPFSRDQRRWVYATAKEQNPYFGFGTDTDISKPGTVIIAHSAFPILGDHNKTPVVPGPKVMGAWRQREKAFRPNSIVNISAMSFGSLSGPAVEALNRGAHLSGCLHNTGEGGISNHHLHGGDTIYQIGTGYFGCRAADGSYDHQAMLATVAKGTTANGSVKAIELKLSQGAKPGLGGLLPASKVTKEIAEARGVEVGVTVESPAGHRAFHDIDGLIDMVERMATDTGLPVGIKAAVGQMGFWEDLAAAMVRRQEGPDFITIDGSEGGTGAGPLVFTDNVAFPFQMAMAKVYKVFVAADLHRDIVFIGAGRLGYPEQALSAMAVGCDMINVGREAMMAIGCVQAQKCHDGHCPTGVATQNKWLIRGLDPTNKAARCANYIAALRYDLLRVAQACGAPHPSLVPPDVVEIVDGPQKTIPLVDRYGIDPNLHRLHQSDIDALSAPATPTSAGSTAR